MYIKRKSKRKSCKTFKRCIALNLSLLSLSTSTLPYFQSAFASNLNPTPKTNPISIKAINSKSLVVSKIMFFGSVIAKHTVFLLNKINGYGNLKNI